MVPQLVNCKVGASQNAEVAGHKSLQSVHESIDESSCKIERVTEPVASHTTP